ncbi:MAG: PspC domain-containing protein [Actinomycetales bacterium]|nr:PspC domain-containing protein [Actinomycetales bacterium]
MPQDGAVSTPVPEPVAPAARRPPFARAGADAVVAGVSAGIGRHLSLPRSVVRGAFVLLTVFGGGVGIAAYLVLWAILPVDHERIEVPAHQGTRREGLFSVYHWVVLSGLVLLLGGLWLGTDAGGWLTDARYAVPLLAIAGGAFVAWYQLDDGAGRRRGRQARWVGVAQVVVGLAVAMIGVVVIVTQGQGPRAVVNGALAAVAVLVGASVIAAPFALRMYRGLQREQAERVRATARADIAAHLHDSVLQTLALIQRKADDQVTVARLARRQERELRSWLYGGELPETHTLAAALAAEVHEVEDEHGVPVEMVVTGDRPLETAGGALVKATREAVLNAVRHGRPPVSVYVEVGPHGAEVYVRDHGEGFDLAAVADDRLGVRESILGRMSRAGGSARIRRLETGTEISLRLPPLASGGPDHRNGSEHPEPAQHAITTKEATP